MLSEPIAELGTYPHQSVESEESDAGVEAVDDDDDEGLKPTDAGSLKPIHDGSSSLLDSGIPDVPPPCWSVTAAHDASVSAQDECVFAGELSYENFDLTCYELKAHAPDDAEEPYTVPITRDHHASFAIEAPWPDVRYIRSLSPIVDAEAVVHHFTLYAPDVSGSGARRLVYSWAPGGGALSLHRDLGILVEPGVTYTLEVHYNAAPLGRSVQDASGVKLCVSATRPSYEVTFSRLGTEQIAGTSATGTCHPQSNRPIFILSGQPQMNTRGRHTRVVLNGAGAGQVVYDEPFDFDYQVLRPGVAAVLQPGESLTTTCTYSAEASFGTGVDDETCYFNVLHWPAHTLTNPQSGPASCLF